MATYDELRILFSHDALRKRIEVACIIAAQSIYVEAPSVDNHANRLIWAKRAFAKPGNMGGDMLRALLAANKDLEVSAITSVTDTAIQAKVDAAVDVFADGT